MLQETYPSTPPVWFAESEETSVTNAVQILSNTSGRDNHVCKTSEFQISFSISIDFGYFIADTSSLLVFAFCTNSSVIGCEVSGSCIVLPSLTH